MLHSFSSHPILCEIFIFRFLCMCDLRPLNARGGFPYGIDATVVSNVHSIVATMYVANDGSNDAVRKPSPGLELDNKLASLHLKSVQRPGAKEHEVEQFLLCFFYSYTCLCAENKTSTLVAL